MLTMVNVGLLCIVIGWYIQLAATKKKKFTLQKNFLLFYAVGAGFLTLYSLGEFGLGTLLNAATAIMAFMVYKRMDSTKGR